MVSWMLYPAPNIAVQSPPPAPYEEILLPLEGGVEVTGWHFDAGEGTPVVLYFHGNGENLQTMHFSGLLDTLRASGLSFLAIDYPGYGRSSGSSSEESLVDAGLASFDYLRERHPERPLHIVGWSLGAATAMQVARRRDDSFERLAVLSPWSSLSDAASFHFPRILVAFLVWEDYDSLSAAREISRPVLVIHGEEDRLIPASQGEELARAFGEKARLLLLSGTGHNDLYGNAEAWKALRTFLLDEPEP